MQKIWIGALLLSLGLVIAQTVQKQLNLSLNGKASGSKAITVNGQNYVPVSALRDLGISASVSGGTLSLSNQPAGGASQRASIEGCMNEFLFNGIWRMQVSKVEPGEAFGQKVWAITAELRNGVSRTLEPGQTGWMDSSGLTIAFADGSTSGVQTSALSREYENQVRSKQIAQGAAITYAFKFESNSAEPPTKLLVQIDPARLQKLGVGYTTPDPSFRFKLDCSR
jgi:hypothetical protein